MLMLAVIACQAPCAHEDEPMNPTATERLQEIEKLARDAAQEHVQSSAKTTASLSDLPRNIVPCLASCTERCTERAKEIEDPEEAALFLDWCCSACREHCGELL